MGILDLLPFRQVADPTDNNVVAKAMDPVVVRDMGKGMKVAALALGFQGNIYLNNNRPNFETAPYDFDRIMQAIDTDSYVKQAMNKYRELFWKEGWKIVGENPEAVSYLYQRIDYMELSMKRPFVDFLTEVVDQIFRYANAFVVKARGDLAPYFPGSLTPIDPATQPIIGYYLIPTEQVRINRDKFNRPKSYQQQTDPFTYSDNDKAPVWTADRVSHFYFDKKTGRAFGTPFLCNVLDDIVALRQMEEDIQNLVHRELFPFYQYRIGTPEQPAEPDEIENAAVEIENMRSEGGLVVPHRHEISVVESKGGGLDASSYLDHFKERVAVGLGVAPHHLGMVMNGGNRSVTDRLDTALYDKIKQYQKIFAEMVRVYFFNELLIEGGFDPIRTPEAEDVSDRCYFKFNEIDVDTQVKKETHVIQKYVNNAISLPEVRLELGLDPDVDEAEMFAAVQGRVQVDVAHAQMQHQAELAAQMPAPSTTSKSGTSTSSDKKTPAPKGQRNLPNKSRGVGNTIRPANQFDRKTSPNIKRSEDFLSLVENLLEDDYTVIYVNDEDKETKEDS